jgi:gluconate:H+ symporter, GntP family
MNPLWILLIGMVVVVGGVLALRLHAFLALILGALVVAALTPADAVYRQALRGDREFRVATATVVGDKAVLTFNPGKVKVAPGTSLQVTKAGDGPVAVVGTATVKSVDAGVATAEMDSNPKFTVAPGDLLHFLADVAAAKKASTATLGDRIAGGFGKTAISIGILIALASIVGETLLISGGAERIVSSCRNAVGDKHVSLAFLVSGFVLGIPVFFDTVFYLLVPLGKVMRIRSGRDYTLYILCIVAGATMTHSLVPPTPGPLFVADALGVKLSTMILAGLVISAVAAIFGYAYALWINRRIDIPLRESASITKEELDAIATRDESTLPPLWLSLLPILLPVVLISVAAFFPEPYAGESSTMTLARDIIQQVGDKNISLLIAAVIGLLMVVMRKDKKDSVGKGVGSALESAGVIILITAAGGAFGQVLQQTDIANSIKDMVPTGKLALLPLAFLVTTLVRTAQGSATVAMITAAGIAGPFALGGDLGFHPVYLALAIGCGSKPIMWMNDSGFWIIGKMSGFTEAETLRTATVMMLIMGVSGLAAIMLGAWLFPMV